MVAKSSAHRCARRAVLLAVAFISAPIATSTAGTPVTWIGGATGDWGATVNWSGGFVPGAANDVFINAGNPPDVNVTVNVSAAETANLAISSGDQVSIEDGRDLRLYGDGTLSTLNNAGTINVLSISGGTGLRFAALANTITGGGTIRLQNASGLSGWHQTVQVTNVNNTIEGDGGMGFNIVKFTNQGTISANHSAKALAIDVGGGGGVDAFVNVGLMRATNGGFLQLTGDYNNTGGTIRAEANSGVFLRAGAVVKGGTLSTLGTGTISGPGGNSVTISNLINAGHYLPGANSTTYVAGTITNIGSFDINPGSGFSSELKVSTGTLMLNGGGEVVLNSHPAALDAALTGFVDTTLVNADNRIHGTGRCGGDFLDIVNQSNGIIDADIAGQQLLVDPDPIIVNNGVIRATNGGRLTLTDGQVTNNGSIQAQNNSRVEIARQTIVTGGVFTTSGSGTIHVSGDASFTNVTNNGNIIIGVPAGSGGVGLFLNGTIDNTGSLNVAASNTDSLLFVQDDTMLIGSGIVNLNDTDGGTPRSQIDGTFGKTLTNVNNTLQGVGFIGNNSIGIINQGTIIASGGTLTLDAIQAGSLINSGMLRATSGGALILTGNDRINFGTFASTGGAMDVQSGGTLVIDDFATLTAGTIVLNGAWKHDGLSTATATNFRGTGSLNLVQGVVSVNANGGDIGTSRLKQLTITTTSGLLDLNDNDLIVDYDAADPLPTLQAYIANARNGGAWNGNGITSSSAKDHPQHATTLGIISAADYFASHGPGSTFDGQAIDASTNLIKYTWYGDTDFNGRVNFDDYVRADNGFNNHLTGWFNGDFDLNGSVNFDDYVLIDLAFNSQSGTLQRALSFLDGSDPSSREMDEPALRRIRQHLDRFGPDYAQHVLAAVPEPASIAGLGLISTFGLARRRRGAKVN